MPVKPWLLFLAASPAFAVVTVTFPNANVFTAPYSCRISSGALIAPTGGCYLKGVVSGTTSIVLNVDSTINSETSANMPSFRVTIDDGASSYVLMGTTDTQTTMASGLTTGSHTYLIQFIGGNQGSGNGWTGTAFQTKINSIQFDTGSTLSAPSVRPNNCLFFGDSYLQAYYGGSQSGNYYSYVDFTTSWPRWVSSALNCEYGQIGVGGQGWVNSGQGGYPAFTSSWDHYDSTHARDLSITPQYLIVAQGNNDHVGSVTTGQINTAVTNWLTAMRAVWPTANSFVLKPFSDVSDATNHTQIVTSVNAYVSANSDAHLWAIDIGTEYQGCLPFSGGATWCSQDGIHPLAVYHGAIAAMVVDKIMTTPAPTGVVSLRGGVTLR